MPEKIRTGTGEEGGSETPGKTPVPVTSTPIRDSGTTSRKDRRQLQCLIGPRGSPPSSLTLGTVYPSLRLSREETQE